MLVEGKQREALARLGVTSVWFCCAMIMRLANNRPPCASAYGHQSGQYCLHT